MGTVAGRRPRAEGVSSRERSSSVERVAWDVVETVLGTWSFAATENGLLRLSISEATSAPLLEWARRWEPNAEFVRDPDPLRPIAAALQSYASGELREFDLRLDLRGGEFELAAWAAMCAIPFGQTRTYGQLADELGVPGGARAIGRAAGANPVPVVVPCHRILAARGLGGFSGGLEHKRRLLRHEGHAVQLQWWSP